MARVFRAILVALAVSLAVPAAALALEPLSSFGSEGMGAGQFGEFGQLTIAADGTLYVGDLGNNRVDVFSPQGVFLFAFGEKVSPAGGGLCTTASGCVRGSDSGAAGSMGDPEGVALGPEGNLFVADLDNNRIDVFTTQGGFLYAFGKAVNAGDHSDVCTAASGCEAGKESSLAGGMKTPRGLGFDGAGNLYVADESNNRIDVFSAGGGFRYAFGKAVNAGDHSDVCTAVSGCEAGTASGSAGAMNRPDDVEALPGSQLAVSDRTNNRVDVFSAGGEFVRAFGEKVDATDHSNVCTAVSGCEAGEMGFAAGAMWAPDELAADGGNGIYVAEPVSNRIDQFSVEGAFLRAFGAGVIAGGEAFEVCTLASKCMQGGSAGKGSLAEARGVAVDCRGTIFVAHEGEAVQVERLGEAGVPGAPCPPAAAPVAPSNMFKLGKLKLNKRKGTATLSVILPGAGSLVLKGRGLKGVRRTIRAAGTVKLPIRAVGKAKKKLLRAGKVGLMARVTFTPTGGVAATLARRLTLKKLTGRQGRRFRLLPQS